VSDTLRTQRDVTRIALRALTDTGFALAGGSAVREHGITTRPTEDVDLFTSHPDADAFSAAVGMVIDALRDAGYQVTQTRTAEQFARLHITSVSKASVIVDMGVDWRMNQPTPLDIGPVLSLEDAVGNKVAALFSRGEPRDYLDVDAIRGWGGFSDTDLMRLAAERDLGFTVPLFVAQLRAVRHITLDDVVIYGVTADDLACVVEHLSAWAADLASKSDLQSS